MPSAPRASASIVVAGIVAIIGAALAVAATIFVLISFRSVSTVPGTPVPSTIRPFLNLVWIFFLACEVFVLLAGVQLIRLRSWARLALLIVASCMLFFGVIGIGVIFFAVFVAPADPAVSKALLATILAFVYGVPVAVALWWLILLSRRSVAAQFQLHVDAPSAPTGSSSIPSPFFNNPQCPLPIRIVGWYLASFVLFLPIVPFLPVHVPAFYLGHVFRGASATVSLFVNLLLLSMAGIGLLLLKRWSYPFTIATQVFLCLNGLIAVFSHSFESLMRETLLEMRLPDLPLGIDSMFRYMRYFNLLGLLVPVAIIVVLAIYRRAFSAAADNNQREALPSQHPAAR